MSRTILKAENLTIQYAECGKTVLNNLCFQVGRGEFVLVVGPSGSGLSTLAKYIAGIIPEFEEAQITGTMEFDGTHYENMTIQDISRRVGLVFQNPREQVFCEKVEDEVSFAVENLNLQTEQIMQAVEKTMEQMDIRQFRDRKVFSLSGGQLQRVVVSSVLARQTDIIVLDEPTADLDPVSKREVLDVLVQIKNAMDSACILFEHSIGEILPFVDRLLVLNEAGNIVFSSTNPQELLEQHGQELEELGIRIPEQFTWSRILKQHNIPLEDPMNLASLSQSIEKLFEVCSQEVFEKREKPDFSDREVKLDIKDVHFAYPGRKTTLEGIGMDIRKGTLNVILGQNGSGKSTTLKLLSKLLKKDRGTIVFQGKDIDAYKQEEYASHVGLVFQNPDTQLFRTTVFDEVAFGLRQQNVDEAEIRVRVDNVFKELNLGGLQEQHPFSLSRGERLRLALATVLVMEPEIILFDEPTTGQDTKTLNALIRLLTNLETEKERTIIVVTHDMNLASEIADYVYVFEQGKICISGDAYTVFSQNVKRLEEYHIIPPLRYRLADRFADQTGEPYDDIYQMLTQLENKFKKKGKRK